MNEQNADRLKHYVVYKHTCTVNNKAYVGYTSFSMEERWNDHVALSNDERENQKKFKFQNAIKKYGKDNFRHEILFQGLVTLREICDIEIKMISDHGTLEPNGYNRTKGGEGVVLTEQGREDHRIATKQALHRPDVRERYLIGIRKGHSTPEFLENNRKAQLIAQNRPDVVKRKRAKMKEFCAKPGYRNPRARRVAQFDLSDNFIQEFSTATEASLITKCNYGKITEVARGCRKQTGGFKWKYVDTNDE